MIRIDKKEVAHVKELYSQILDVDVVVDKKQDIYFIDNVRAHLDVVEGLGTFLEFEAVYKNDSQKNREKESEKVQELMKAFEIKQEELFQGSYRELARNRY